MIKILAWLADTVFFWFPPLIGGLVDYCNQVSKGHKKWSYYGFAAHLLSAMFFGWICGTVAHGLEYSPNIVAASGGMGGFLGVRVADLITYRFIGERRAG